MKSLIIGNGNVNDVDFHKRIAADCELIIACDGGANNAHKMGLIPNLIVGDMDSVRDDVLKEFEEKSKIVEDPDQDKTDLQIGFEHLIGHDVNEVVIIGGIGTRMDHTWSNVLLAMKYHKQYDIRIVDEHNDIKVVSELYEFEGAVGDVISIVPLTDVFGLTYTGLYWGVNDLDVKAGWSGSSNKMSAKKASVDLKSGVVMVIKTTE